MNQDIIQWVQDELEVRVRTAVQNVLSRDTVRDRVVPLVDFQVEMGRRAVAELLKGVDVEALAVGTTFRAPHVNLSPEVERLWVRTENGILCLIPMSEQLFMLGAVDPLKVHSVQAPAEDR